MVRASAAQRDFAVGGRSSDSVRGGFDAIRDDRMFRAIQFFHPGDSNRRTASTGDIRSHGDQKAGQIHDLRFTSGAFDDGHTFSKSGSHHHIGRPQHRRTGAAAEKHCRAHQSFRAGVNVSTVNHHPRAQGLKAFQVQVDRPRPDHATARQGHGCLFQSPQQRAHDANRAAHFPDQIVIARALHFL